jgi:hypothetical protein
MPRAIPIKELSTKLSERLASFDLTDAVIQKLARRVTVEGLTIARFDPCIYGICVDYFSDKPVSLEQFSSKNAIAKWEVFPYGIIDWDRFLVRVAYNVNELEGKGIVREFGL